MTLEHWHGETKNLFRREAIRIWMVNVNRRGGVVLPDALPSNALAALLRDEAARALETAAE